MKSIFEESKIGREGPCWTLLQQVKCSCMFTGEIDFNQTVDLTNG